MVIMVLGVDTMHVETMHASSLPRWQQTRWNFPKKRDAILAPFKFSLHFRNEDKKTLKGLDIPAQGSALGVIDNEY